LDGELWRPLPEWVELTGSKYAVLARHLRKADLTISLNDYRVMTGDQPGKRLGEYVRYQVNKACAMLYPGDAGKRIETEVAYVADLVDPYCVFVR